MHVYINILEKSSKNQEKSGVYVFTSHAVNNQQIFIIYEDSVPNKFIIQELFTEMKNIESLLSYAKNQVSLTIFSPVLAIVMSWYLVVLGLLD